LPDICPVDSCLYQRADHAQRQREIARAPGDLACVLRVGYNTSTCSFEQGQAFLPMHYRQR
jgi:hypothetical protein